MVRPCKMRMVGIDPSVVYFKPRGIPLKDLEEVVLAKDELEAMRLADLEGLYHETVAERMGVSRQTVGRLLEFARKKVVDAIVNGKAIKIEGGNVAIGQDLPVAMPRRGRCFRGGR